MNYLTKLHTSRLNFRVIIFLFLLGTIPTFSQVYSNKVITKNNEQLIDSLKTAEYPYSLPIWGKKVAQKGYQLPYSARVSLNYFYNPVRVQNPVRVGVEIITKNYLIHQLPLISKNQFPIKSINQNDAFGSDFSRENFLG